MLQGSVFVVYDFDGSTSNQPYLFECLTRIIKATAKSDVKAHLRKNADDLRPAYYVLTAYQNLVYQLVPLTRKARVVSAIARGDYEGLAKLPSVTKVSSHTHILLHKNNSHTLFNLHSPPLPGSGRHGINHCQDNRSTCGSCHWRRRHQQV